MDLDICGDFHPFVSIILLTYNAEKTVKKCLDSLFSLDFPKNSYEVIVVEGGSTDKTQRIVSRYPVRMFIDLRRSRGAARNMGIKYAKGGIIAFIDADCVAEKKWLKFHVYNHLQYSDIIAVVGSIDHPNISGLRWLDRAIHDGEFSPFSPKRFISGITTSNVSFKKKNTSKRIIFFRDKLHTGEDVELCSRLLTSGYKILFDPKARILHLHSVNFDYVYFFMKKFLKSGGIHYRLQNDLSKGLAKFKLPADPIIIFLMLPPILLLRIIRFFHKMKYVNKKSNIIRYFHYVFLASVFWVSGYFLEAIRTKHPYGEAWK